MLPREGYEGPPLPAQFAKALCTTRWKSRNTAERVVRYVIPNHEWESLYGK